MPAKNATRCMAPAAPVFAAEAAPTGTVQTSSFTQSLQNIIHLRALRMQSTEGGPGRGQSMEPTITHHTDREHQRLRFCG